ncbi:hypothetical protein BH11MYX3_BH11MYX3_19380 [soil metagenome]
MRYLISTLLLSLAACAGSATYRGTATYDSPDLVYAEPGVQVVADYDEPIFYADNFYWRNDGGRWYRSSYYNRGWVYANPPQVVARIQSPARYRHYRPNGYTVRRHDARGRTVIRDHRRR